MRKLYCIILCLTIVMSNIVLVHAEGRNKHGISASVATFVRNGSEYENKTGEQLDKTTLIAGRGREAFLQFDLSKVDINRIQSAMLYLTTEHGGSNTVNIKYLPNNNWNKDITYKTKPNTDGEILITSFKTGIANRGNGTYSRSETDVTEFLRYTDGKISFHISGGEYASEFASNVSQYTDRAPMLFISYGDAEDDDNIQAVNQAKEYLTGGITITGAISDYKASNGITASITWDKVYDNTILDEKGTYLNDTYLKPNGMVERPKWYEGIKRLKGNAVISAGNIAETAENINIFITQPSVPGFDVNTLSNYIDIGNVESENAGRAFECVRDNGIETNIVGGMTHTYRTLNKNGAMALTMKCDPDKINYLTVKLWGNDSGDTMLWVCDPVTGNMNISNSGQPTRSGIVDRRDWIELNFLNASPQYNGGFIYSTYVIPAVYTKGKEYVSLRLYSTGGNSNYGSVAIKDQIMPSRGIYAAYMTQSPNFNPSEFEAVTGRLTETAPAMSKTYDEQKQLTWDYTRKAVEHFKSWQIYGQNNYPSYMEGMVTRRTDWRDKPLTDDDWKNKYYQSSYGMLRQNMTPLNMYEIFACAYKNAEKFDYSVEEKAELLDRVIKGIDFLVRAQGSNGGFFSSDGWIGGPQRREASGNHLTGFGLRSVAQAMITICNDVDFDVEIDSDADGRTDMVRSRAWEQMAAAARDYLVSLDGAGHAPNQDMADIIAALRFEKALQLMNSGLSWKAQNRDDEIEKQLDMALGFSPNIACSSYWVSPKGLILENFGSIQGGYSGDYGIEAIEEMSQLVEFAESYYGKASVKAKKYTDLINKAYECADKFMFTANSSDSTNPTLYAEGIISNRNAYYPGTERYVLDYYTSLQKKNKTALKTFDYFFKHNNLENDSGNYSPGNAHFEDNALSVMKLYLNFDAIVSAINEEDIGNYNYLMENDNMDEYAWADEMGRNVVIKNGADKIYVALNWRNPIHSGTYYNTSEKQNQQSGMMNNLARVHHTTDIYDKYGYAAVETDGWSVKTAEQSNWQLFANHYAEAFMYMNYGDYKIIMNSNNLMGNETDISYPIPWEKLDLDGVYRDLVSGKYYYFGNKTDGAYDGKTVQISPASTMVLYKTDPTDIPGVTPEPDATPIPTVTTEPTLTLMPIVTQPPVQTEIPISTPEVTGEPHKNDVDINYDDINVTVRLNRDTINEKVFVYAAEYSDKGILIKVQMKYKQISGKDEIEFECKRETQGNKIKVFVWNSEQKPLCKSGEW